MAWTPIGKWPLRSGRKRSDRTRKSITIYAVEAVETLQSATVGRVALYLKATCFSEISSCYTLVEKTDPYPLAPSLVDQHHRLFRHGHARRRFFQWQRCCHRDKFCGRSFGQFSPAHTVLFEVDHSLYTIALPSTQMIHHTE